MRFVMFDIFRFQVCDGIYLRLNWCCRGIRRRGLGVYAFFYQLYLVTVIIMRSFQRLVRVVSEIHLPALAVNIIYVVSSLYAGRQNANREATCFTNLVHLGFRFEILYKLVCKTSIQRFKSARRLQ
jgi:hypothetical protein